MKVLRSKRLRSVRPLHVGTNCHSQRVLGAVLWGAVTTCLVVFGTLESLPSGSLLIVLTVLMIGAEHRDRLFGDETSISGSIAVGICSVLAFRSDGALLGPLICGAAAGLYWPHLREHAWAKVAINSASIGLSAMSAAWTVALLRPDPTDGFQLIACLAPAIVVYWFVNSAILGAAMAVGGSGSFNRHFAQLIKSETEMLVFAFAGGLCGFLMLEVDTWVGVLALALVLVAVDVLVISKPRPATVRMQHPGLAAAIGRMTTLLVSAGAAFGFTELLGPIGAAPLGAVAGGLLTFVTILGVYRRRMSAWEPQIALGVVWADAPEVIAAAVAGSVAASAGWVAGGIVVVVAVAAALAATRWRQGRRDDDDEKDALALALVQLALLDRPEHATPAS